MLCPYDVNNNPLDIHGRWVKTRRENHHSAIFITDTAEEGVAFDINNNIFILFQLIGCL